ncbi:MAG: DegT/DnrJ/EryC1/StrS family aminotransferase [Candidatus Parabeggiatoa sp.]|nr:DegT/DnrJ/EryC1/StrS family aminotransferase [Candidatus Parabeggiatoa sp.]
MILLLIPDLPSTEQLLPWLQRIDTAQWYSNFGPLVQAFESQMALLLSHDQAIPLTTVSNGTTALELALLALDIPKDRYALTPALTFPATGTAIKQVGLRPIFTDVDPQSWLLTPDIARQVLKKLKKFKKRKVDVIVPVAAFGCPQPVAEWDQLSEETGIPVLIDAAAAFGSQAVGQRCIITFSFHATKPFGIGEGGLVVAQSAELINKIRRLSNFGFENGLITQCGSNAKLSEYHAAVGLAQLARWPQIVAHRQKIWHDYLEHLRVIEQVSVQRTPNNLIPAILAVKISDISDLSALTATLLEHGIPTRRWYCPPLSAHPAFSGAEQIAPDGSTQLTVTKELARSLLGLPFHRFLKQEQIAEICGCLRRTICKK